MTADQRAHIDALDHVGLCRLWRFAELGDPLVRGEAGEHVRHRLFDELGGFTPQISKQIGWDRP